MLRSGFFNSKNHDKKYYSSDISRLFNALITDGIFQNIGQRFNVRPGTGMQVVVSTGMSYINSTWTFNDTDYVVNIDEVPYVSGFKRIDGVFIRSFDVNSINYRDNELYYMKGTETSSTPSIPVPTAEEGEVFTPICYITVSNGDEEITASAIRNVVGTSESPFITGILETADISSLFSQWEAQWNDWVNSETSDFATWMTNKRTDFDEWFDRLKITLSGDVAGNLQMQIDDNSNGIREVTSNVNELGYQLSQKFLFNGQPISNIDFRLDGDVLNISITEVNNGN